MVDKKPKAVKENKPKVKESKSESFIRIAKPRVKSVLKSLRILGNCSNRNNYEYTQEQINSMSIKLSEALENTITEFHKSKKEIESFEF